jgi:AraC-like DNA-binding protein
VHERRLQVATGFNIKDSDVLATDLSEHATLTGPGFQLLRPLMASPQAILHGDHRIARLRSGLSIHTSDTVTLQDVTTVVEQPAGLTVMVFLSGAVDATIGGVPLDVGRRADEPVRGVMISRARADRFVRHARKGDRMRKVTVTVSPAWLGESGFDGTADRQTLQAFCRTHLARVDWVASPALIAIAEQMLHPPENGIYPEHLYLESRALDLLAEAFAALAARGRAKPLAQLSPVDARRLQAIEENMQAADAEGLSIEQLARLSGVSVSKMQRLFRLAHDMTASEFIRRRHLLRARQLLEREGVSVAVAADVAGYASAANFATAFRREFGLSPREARKSAKG